jgi:glucosamine 6-phosphate synthetase-like amidotransferase/phosphosugar isomerase protein
MLKNNCNLPQHLVPYVLQIKQGEQFISETDTEVIPKLCKFIFNNLGDKLPFPKASYVLQSA